MGILPVSFSFEYTMIALETYRQWFFDHLQTFDLSDPMLYQAWDVKVEHSLCVSKNCKTIAQALQMSQVDCQLAELIGLLHDIGRFHQIIQFNTFSDVKSVDHAQLGIDVIKKEKILSNLPDDFQKIVMYAIDNHNKATIQKDLKAQPMLFSKILRDADKLDILRLVTEYYLHPNQKRNGIIELDLPDEARLSKSVIAEISKRQMVKRSSMKTRDDFKILQMSWIYDIHFSITVKKILAGDYIKKLKRVLPQTDETERIYHQVSEDLKQKIEID